MQGNKEIYPNLLTKKIALIYFIRYSFLKFRMQVQSIAHCYF